MKQSAFWIVNKTNSHTAEIYLYGYIGYSEDMKTSMFIKELKDLHMNFSSIKLRINSGGGNVYDGIAMINAIKECVDKISVYIDGVAASMAAIIAAVVPNCYMNKYARYMTHRVSAGCYGNADEMRAAASQCEGLEDNLAEMLAQKTGLSKEQAKAKYITNQDRWLTAEQALKEGLIKGVYDGEQIDVPETVANEKDLVNFYQTAFSNTIESISENSTIILI